MQKSDLQKFKLPTKPGVYTFLDSNKNVLYVGKASSLRDRVKSYFSSDLNVTRGQVIVQMITDAVSVEWTETDSVVEALILESRLIKKQDPPANRMGKDDKSYNYVIITKEDYPRVLIRRERDLEKDSSHLDIRYLFGPFTNGSSLHIALRLIRKIFPFRDTCKIDSGKPCFNAQIGLCPGVCTGNLSKREYARTIQNIRLFFEGKKTALRSKLTSQMKRASKAQNFESAKHYRDALFAIDHINDVALIRQDAISVNTSRRVEAYDIAHMSGDAMVGVMTVLENGTPSTGEYRKFKINTVSKANDTKALKEVLLRRFNHPEWTYPSLVVIDGGKAQLNAAKRVFDDVGLSIPLVSVVKDEKHRPKGILGSKLHARNYEQEILLANAESHRFAIAFHRKKRDSLS